MRIIKLKTSRLRPFVEVWKRRIGAALATALGSCAPAFAQDCAHMESEIDMGTAVVVAVGIFMVGLHLFQVRSGADPGNRRLWVTVLEFLVTASLLQCLKLAL